MGALVSHPLCLVGSWGACTPPATAAQAHLFSPVASALWPLPTTPPFLLLFPHSPPSYVFSHTFSSSFLASPRHYTPRPPGPMHSFWQHREAPPVSLGGDPPLPPQNVPQQKPRRRLRVPTGFISSLAVRFPTPRRRCWGVGWCHPARPGVPGTGGVRRSLSEAPSVAAGSLPLVIALAAELLGQPGDVVPALQALGHQPGLAGALSRALPDGVHQVLLQPRAEEKSTVPKAPALPPQRRPVSPRGAHRPHVPIAWERQAVRGSWWHPTIHPQRGRAGGPHTGTPP